MKYAVILQRKKKHSKITTQKLIFYSLEDASHYEEQIRQHDSKVIHTELHPVFS